MKYVYILISSLFSTIGHGQLAIVNTSLTDNLQDVFYIGVDNAIELNSVKDNAEYLVVVKGAGSSINHDKDNRYIVRVTTTDSCRVIVSNKNGKKILEKNYQTRTIPSAVPTLGGQRDTTITIGRILANPFLNVVFPGCYLRMYIRVVFFKAAFIHDNDSTFTENGGYMLSAEQVQLIKTLRSGDKIYFHEIYVVSPDSKRQHMPSFWTKIE